MEPRVCQVLPVRAVKMGAPERMDAPVMPGLQLSPVATPATVHALIEDENCRPIRPIDKDHPMNHIDQRQMTPIELINCKVCSCVRLSSENNSQINFLIFHIHCTVCESSTARQPFSMILVKSGNRLTNIEMRQNNYNKKHLTLNQAMRLASCAIA
jgi:hypothetical protein